MKTLSKFAAIAALGTAVLFGQTTIDSSGNGLLKGNYRFRQVAVLNIDVNGNPTEVAGAFGVIAFSGTGSYTVTGTYYDNTISGGAQQAFPASSGSTYTIGGNGQGYIISPMNVILGGSNAIYGGVAQGVFAGSDTEDGDVSDIFIAIPAGTPPANASFKTNYSVGLLDFTAASSAAVKNALFNLTPNGAGGLGTITLTGQANNQSAATLTQTVTGASYNFGTDGNANLVIPLPSGVTTVNALFVNNKSMYVSSDGNFVLGWTAGGFDIFFGVSALTSSATNAIYQGTYYTSALEEVPTGYGVDNYYGSNLSAAGNGNEIVHERLEYPGYYAYDFVTDDYTQMNANGTTADTNGYQYAFGDGGKAFVAIGTPGLFSLVVGMQAPACSGSGVYICPTGIYNSASYAPITASIAPGELLTLYGFGLSSGTMTASGSFPNSLGNVQVLMNNIPAPIYYVSPGQISAVVPYELSPSSSEFVATIQVNNNGQLSNPVTLYLTDALPGIFTQNETGIGFGAVLHNADFSLVTSKNPAEVGEYIDIFLTGLGTVTPTVQDGAPGPTNPLSYADLFTSHESGWSISTTSTLAPTRRSRAQ